MFWYYLMPVIFVLGILGIAFEEQIKINKTATALLMCVLLWSILLIDTNLALVTEGFRTWLKAASQVSPDSLEPSDYLAFCGMSPAPSSSSSALWCSSTPSTTMGASSR